MKLFERILLAIRNNRLKVMLLFLIVFVLGNIIGIAYGIRTESQRVEKIIKDEIGGTVTINRKEGLIYDESFERSSVDFDVDLARQLGSFDEVVSYDFSLPSIGWFTNYLYTVYAYESRQFGDPIAEGKTAYLTFSGTERKNIFDLENGNGTLLQGRTFTEDEINQGYPVVVLPREFAEINNVTVGSTFTIKNIVHDYSNSVNGQTANFPILAQKDVLIEVVGIYEPLLVVPEFPNRRFSRENNINYARRDTFYAPNKFIENQNMFQNQVLLEHGFDGISIPYTPIYILKSADDVPRFIEKATPYLPENLQIVSTTDVYDEFTFHLKVQEKISLIIMFVVIGMSIILLIIFLKILLRDRLLEIGVLLSLGETKQNVYWQLLLEMLLIVVVAITLSIPSGQMWANSLTDGIGLQDEMTEEEKVIDGLEHSLGSLEIRGYQKPINPDRVNEEFEIPLSPMYILIVITGSSVITIAVISLSLRKIFILNPKEILLSSD